MMQLVYLVLSQCYTYISIPVLDETENHVLGVFCDAMRGSSSRVPWGI
jgi:hypothetical protein